MQGKHAQSSQSFSLQMECSTPQGTGTAWEGTAQSSRVPGRGGPTTAHRSELSFHCYSKHLLMRRVCVRCLPSQAQGWGTRQVSSPGSETCWKEPLLCWPAISALQPHVPKCSVQRDGSGWKPTPGPCCCQTTSFSEFFHTSKVPTKCWQLLCMGSSQNAAQNRDLHF